MNHEELAAVRRGLEEFAAEMLAPVARADQRDKGRMYLRGLLLGGRRKSMQPMAERLGVARCRPSQLRTGCRSWLWAASVIE